jgi:hypothetical protein
MLTKTRTSMFIAALPVVAALALPVASAGAAQPPAFKHAMTTHHTAPKSGGLPRPYPKARKQPKSARRGVARRHANRILAQAADTSVCNPSGCYRQLSTFHWQTYPQLNQYGNHFFGWTIYEVTDSTGYRTFWKYWSAWNNKDWIWYTRVSYPAKWACWTYGGDANCPG